MQTKIVLLPDDVVNQIKAGEVIENPASVVKELVDNAIDAGAKRIAIEIQAGGQQLICVEDDGCGMGRADVELSLLRHATSKIFSVEDLDRLQTMGFRGEALAAIASIAKLEIRTSNGKEATSLLAEGGRIEQIQPCARNQGTTVEVRSLFFNAPARRKFQKSVQANSSQIVKVVQTLALAHPEIAFVLRSQGQTLLEVEVSSWKQRILELLECKEGLFIEEQHLFGFLGPSEELYATRQKQHFFINRRPIFSPLLAKALTEGYGTRLAVGAHPAAVLFLKKAPHEFDVNVHPQKKEVRFREESHLFREVKEAIARGFLPSELPHVSLAGPVTNLPFFSAPSSFVRYDVPLREEPPTEALPWELPRARALAVVDCFLLVEREREVFLVDLRKERLLSSQKSDRQSLLIPIEISLSLEEAERAEEWLERCTKAGVEARVMGRRRLCLDAIPGWLEAKEAASFFEALKEEGSIEQILERWMKRHPVKMSLEEAEWLWKSKTPREVPLTPNELERILARQA